MDKPVTPFNPRTLEHNFVPQQSTSATKC